MRCLKIEIPDQVMYDTKMTVDQANKNARLVLAMYYYEKLGVSIGYCAQIAGTTEEDFIQYLGKNHISVFHFDNEREFDEEMMNA